MGTPLRHVLDRLGGGPVPGAPVKAVLSGVANPVILGDQLDVPVSHEGMKSIGGGLGSAGFMVFAERTDQPVAAGVARFLSIESCGQCTPCKTDGATLYELLARLAASNATAADLDEIEHRINTVAYGARVQPGNPTRDRAGEHPRPLPRRVRSPPPPRRRGCSHLHRRARRRLRRSGPRRRPPSAQAARLDVRTAYPRERLRSTSVAGTGWPERSGTDLRDGGHRFGSPPARAERLDFSSLPARARSLLTVPTAISSAVSSFFPALKQTFLDVVVLIDQQRRLVARVGGYVTHRCITGTACVADAERVT